MDYQIIVAHDLNGGIGYCGDIPWKLPTDMSRFRTLTINSCVVMGRKTWESIPTRFRPLPNRINIVLSSQSSTNDSTSQKNVYFVKSWEQLDSLIKSLFSDDRSGRVFFIGGQQIYKEAINRYDISILHITQVLKKYNCDTFFESHKSNLGTNSNLVNYECTDSKFYLDTGIPYRYQKWQKLKVSPCLNVIEAPNVQESQYLNLLCHVAENGRYVDDRTNVGTLSSFDGHQLKFDISSCFPLLTTKRVFFRGVAEELFFFLSGMTNVKILQDKKITIWDGNSSRSYLDSIGQSHRAEGDLGKFYGFQWRHWGADYKDCTHDYTGKGFDQIKMVTDLIKNDPKSRRILLSAWNPADLKETCLPPCFVKGTNVLTESGYKLIENVTMEDKLMSHLGEYRKINQIYITPYKKELYEIGIKYKDKPIICTPDHPFYVKKIGQLPQWVPANQLSQEHYVSMKTIHPLVDESGYDEKSLPFTDESYFLLIGYYFANGKIDKENKCSLIINIKPTHVGAFVQIGWQLEHIEGDNYRLIDTILVNIIKTHFTKNNEKHIPGWMIKSPKRFIKNFIDGFVHVSATMDNESKSDYLIVVDNRQVALSIQHMYMSSLLIYVDIVGNIDSNGYTIIVHKEPENLDKTHPDVNNDYTWFPITDIKVTRTSQFADDTGCNETIDVYNFDVDIDHTYIVDNCCVHNCHVMYQFNVDSDGKTLSCSMYQRSADLFLGIPFNIASTALLTYLIAKTCGLKPNKIIMTLGDAHVYLNHLNQIHEQIARIPRKFPKLNITKTLDNLEDYKFSDLELIGYDPHGKLEGTMAV
jgi:dihydrofolate reductase/thymidylate synthase